MLTLDRISKEDYPSSTPFPTDHPIRKRFWWSINCKDDIQKIHVALEWLPGRI